MSIPLHRQPSNYHGPTPSEPTDDAARLAEIEADFITTCTAATTAGLMHGTLVGRVKSVLKALSNGSHRIGSRPTDEIIATADQLMADIQTKLPRADGEPAQAPQRETSARATVAARSDRPDVSPAPLPLSVLEDTLFLLEELEDAEGVTERHALLTRAVTPRPWRDVAVLSTYVLDDTDGSGALRAFVRGRAADCGDPRDILAAWCHAHDVPPTRVLRRRVERLVAKYRLKQHTHDERRQRPPVMRSCPPLIQALILQVACARRGATNGAIAAAVAADLPAWRRRALAVGVTQPIPTPTAVTVGRFRKRWPLAMERSLTMSKKDALNAMRPRDRYSKATLPNVAWHLDHVTLDIAVLDTTGAEPAVVRPWLTGLIDEATGMCLGWVIDAKPPNAFSTSRVLYRALTPWRDSGRVAVCCPRVLRHDRGRDFLSRHVERILDNLAIAQDICAPRHPNERPEIERFFGTLHLAYSAQPGYCGKGGLSLEAVTRMPDRLLTLPSLIQCITDWTMQYNTQVTDGTRATIAQRWAEHLGASAPEDLVWRLLKSDTVRTIQRGGIELNARLYRGSLKHPDGRSLAELIGTKARVYSTPDMVDRIWMTTCESDESSREEAYLGHVDLIAPGSPALQMEDDFGDARDSLSSILQTAEARTRRDQRVEQREALLREAAPVTDLVTQRAAATADAAREQRRTARVAAAYADICAPDAWGTVDDNETHAATGHDATAAGTTSTAASGVHAS